MLIGIVGCFGKMGRYITDLLIKNDYKIVAGLDIKGEQSPFFVTSKVNKFFAKKFDLLVDFSNKDISQAIIEKALRKNIKVISGTTGLSSEFVARIATLAKNKGASLILCPNFTFGINALRDFVEKNARYYPERHIIESHHASKLDSPSGTALFLAKIADVPLCNVVANRVGDVLGEHQLVLRSCDEEITLIHKTLNKHAYDSVFLGKITIIASKELVIEY